MPVVTRHRYPVTLAWNHRQEHPLTPTSLAFVERPLPRPTLLFLLSCAPSHDHLTFDMRLLRRFLEGPSQFTWTVRLTSHCDLLYSRRTIIISFLKVQNDCPGLNLRLVSLLDSSGE